MLKDLQEKFDDIESIKEIANDLINNAGDIQAVVISYADLQGTIWTFNQGSIPLNLGMLKCLEKEILSKWEVHRDA